MENPRCGSDPDESLSCQVVTRVAAWKDVDPIELDPLYDVIDPDALDALFTGGDGQLSFAYSGCEVVVESTGQVFVQEPQAPRVEKPASGEVTGLE